MTAPVCLITGVGPGTGAALVRRFAAGGYRVAMLARNAERLEALAAEVAGTAAHPCDVVDVEQLRATYERIRSTWAAPDVVIHNAVGGAFGDFQQIDLELLRQNFEVNTMALLQLGRLAAPDMEKAGKGAILCTGNTSAYRGKANFAGLAPTKAAQRILAESMARSLGPKGIHVAFVAIDAVIDLAWTRKRMPDAPDEFFCKPEDIAEECWHVAHQARSAWSFNVEIRPFGESW